MSKATKLLLSIVIAVSVTAVLVALVYALVAPDSDVGQKLGNKVRTESSKPPEYELGKKRAKHQMTTLSEIDQLDMCVIVTVRPLDEINEGLAEVLGGQYNESPGYIEGFRDGLFDACGVDVD